MIENMTYIVLGDSEAGKSSFIKSFVEKDIADSILYATTGHGQQTRFDVIYKFKTRKIAPSIQIRFKQQEEMVMQWMRNTLKNLNLSPNEDLSSFLNENIELIQGSNIEDLLDDEFFKLNEICKSYVESYNAKLKEISNSDELHDFYKKIYKDACNNIANVYRDYGFCVRINGEYDLKRTVYMSVSSDINSEQYNEDIEKYKLLLRSVFQDTVSDPSSGIKLYDNNVRSLAGIVSSVEFTLSLRDGYAKLIKEKFHISSVLDLDTLTLIDTYGLDHDGSTIEELIPRFKEIFEKQHKNIDKVLFIWPMVGNAARYDEKLKALLEVKPGIQSLILYTKFDLFVKSDCKKKYGSGSENYLKELKKEGLDEFIDDFHENNKNRIRPKDIRQIFEDAEYSVDVAESRTSAMINNVLYFTGIYEDDVVRDIRELVSEFNTFNFERMLSTTLLYINNMVDYEKLKGIDFKRELIKALDDSAELIRDSLIFLFDSVNSIIHSRLERAGNFPNILKAVSKREKIGKLGYVSYNDVYNPLLLDIQEILKDKFKEIFFKNKKFADSLLENKKFGEHQLAVYIRECISMFIDYYFCTGCKPCDFLKMKAPKLDTVVQHTQLRSLVTKCNYGYYKDKERKYRGNNCSRFHRIYETKTAGCWCNQADLTTGIFFESYGREQGCLETCIWNLLEMNKVGFKEVADISNFEKSKLQMIVDSVCKEFADMATIRLEKSKELSKIL